MSSADLSLTPDDITWVRAHAAAVKDAFGPEFVAASDRFAQGQLLLDRFNAAIETVLKNGKGYFSGVDEDFTAVENCGHAQGLTIPIILCYSRVHILTATVAQANAPRDSLSSEWKRLFARVVNCGAFGGFR